MVRQRPFHRRRLKQEVLQGGDSFASGDRTWTNFQRAFRANVFQSVQRPGLLLDVLGSKNTNAGLRFPNATMPQDPAVRID